MSTRKKRFAAAALMLVSLYAFAPVGAGILNTNDLRGPKIFAEVHHALLYKVGYSLAGHYRHDGEPRQSFMQKRSWFYGIPGDRMPEQPIREEFHALSQQR